MDKLVYYSNGELTVVDSIGLCETQSMRVEQPTNIAAYGGSIALFYQTECVVRDLDDIATVLCVFKHMPYNSNFCLLGNGCILSGEMEYNPFTGKWSDTNIRCVVDGQIFYKNISWPVCGQVTDNLWVGYNTEELFLFANNRYYRIDTYRPSNFIQYLIEDRAGMLNYIICQDKAYVTDGSIVN